jgi:hypothetical protein
MSLLKSIEQKIEGAVERGFGRIFRSPVQPVELARKLAREMDAGKRVSVAGIYAPNDFTIFLSPTDREAFSSFEPSLQGELSAYLTDHAREAQLTLSGPPGVNFETDSDLRVGEFGIAARVSDRSALTPPRPAPPAPSRAEEKIAEAPIVASPMPAAHVDEPALDERPEGLLEAAGEDVNVSGAEDGTDSGHTVEPLAPPAPALVPALPAPSLGAPPVPPPPAVVPATPNDALRGVQGTQIITPEQARAAGLVREDVVTLTIGSDRHRVTKRTTTMGRSRDCDVVIADSNASRVHIEIRHVGSEFLLVDMKSTNGTRVNGKRITRHQLSDGDVIELGTTQIAVERT